MPEELSALDLSKIDWAKLAALIQLALQFLLNQQPKAMAAHFCCEEDHAVKMKQAAIHNLTAAQLCLDCCQDQG